MFVLKMMLDRNLKGLGCGMAFGPGLTAESMIFELADHRDRMLKVPQKERRQVSRRRLLAEIGGTSAYE
jgi:hypothetical protein